MKKRQLAASALASALLAATVSSALGYNGLGTIGTKEADGKFKTVAEWFSSHPSEFRSFLKAVREGNVEGSDSILALAGISSTELVELGGVARGYVAAETYFPKEGPRLKVAKHRKGIGRSQPRPSASPKA